MKTHHLSKLILSFLIMATSLQSGAAADALCVNQEARKYAVQVLNSQQNEKKKPLTETDVFSKAVVIDNKKQSAFLLYTTMGELVADVMASQAFHKSEVSEFTYHWRFFWNMPRGTQDNTPLASLFCTQARQP